MKCYLSDGNERLAEQEIAFTEQGGGEMQKVQVYPQISYQQVIGMGGAFTEAAAYVYSKMSPEKQAELLDLYFGEKGNRYNFCRTHIESCDFALGNYAYVEDMGDRELRTFSIERDREYLLPFIKAALERNQELKLLASPWSPPAFMKTNGEMNHGGKLKEEYRQMWADVIVKYIEAYRKEGVTISRLTVQNEPAAVQTWDSCIYSGREEAVFARDFLRPALDRAGYADVKINIWDHNKDIIIERTAESFSVPDADKAVDGIAFHWYSGEHFEALAEVRRQYPEKELLFTEGCVEYSRFASDHHVANAEMYAHELIGNFNAGMNGFMDWNMILDQQGGPNHVGNYCDAPVMCDLEKDTIDVKLSYYYIGHFSRFIKPGAKRILASKYSSNLEVTAFENEDGTKALVVLNRSERDTDFVISEGTRSTGKLKSRKHSIMTFCWS